jgi:Uncharacterized protein conserved in bacteria
MSPAYFRRPEFLSIFALVVVVVGICTAQFQASAREYPARPLRLVVPYELGGPADRLARDIGARLGHELGQTVIVENRGAAGVAAGARHVAEAVPDGYTLLLGSRASHVVKPITDPLGSGYDHVQDFTPLAAIGQQARVVAVDGPAGVSSEQPMGDHAIEGVPTWFGLFAPAGIPRDREAKLVGALQKVLDERDLPASPARLGVAPMRVAPWDFSSFLKRDLAEWQGVMRAASLSGRS